MEDAGLGVGQAAAAVAAEALSTSSSTMATDSVLGRPRPCCPLTPLSISQHHGTDPESVGAIAPVDGDYVVAVSGYNGSTSNDPYLVRARVFTPTSDASCDARSFPYPAGASGPIPAIAADVNTVFLTHPARLEATYGAAEAADIANALAERRELPGGEPGPWPQGPIVPVNAYPGVTAAYAAWDRTPARCPRPTRPHPP